MPVLIHTRDLVFISASTAFKDDGYFEGRSVLPLDSRRHDLEPPGGIEPPSCYIYHRPVDLTRLPGY